MFLDGSLSFRLDILLRPALAMNLINIAIFNATADAAPTVNISVMPDKSDILCTSLHSEDDCTWFLRR